jgi:hypothetical protein
VAGKQALPTVGQYLGRLESRGWRRALTLRSYFHPRPPPPTYPSHGPLPRCRQSSGAGKGPGSDARDMRDRLGNATAQEPGKSRPGPRNTLPAIALFARPAGPGNRRVSVTFRGCDASNCMESGRPARRAGPNQSPQMPYRAAEIAIRPPASRETLPDPGKGIAPLGGIRKRRAFPRPRATVPRRSAGPGTRQASARPGGCEAPALGRDGRWPGALAPGWPRISRAQWQGRWPLPGCARRARRRKRFPLCGQAAPAAGPFSASS